MRKQMFFGVILAGLIASSPVRFGAKPASPVRQIVNKIVAGETITPGERDVLVEAVNKWIQANGPVEIHDVHPGKQAEVVQKVADAIGL